MICRFADLTLAGQEDQDVARAGLVPQLVDGIGHRIEQIKVSLLFKGPPALFDRKQAPRDGDHRRRPARAGKVLCESISIDRRRRDDDLQVGPARQDLAQVAEQEVDIQAAFMRLVNDQGVVGLEQRVILGFGQQDAVGHQLDRCPRLQAVLKPHFVADHFTQRCVEFLCNALGHARGRNPPRLGMADQAAPTGAQAAAQAQYDLGQLRGLARAGFAADDDHGMRTDQARDLIAPCRDRQRFWEGDGRDRRGRCDRASGARVHGARIISGPGPGPGRALSSMASNRS